MRWRPYQRNYEYWSSWDDMTPEERAEAEAESEREDAQNTEEKLLDGGDPRYDKAYAELERVELVKALADKYIDE